MFSPFPSVAVALNPGAEFIGQMEIVEPFNPAKGAQIAALTIAARPFPTARGGRA